MDLWSMPFRGEIPWDIVDAFLWQRQREGPRIEYRERFSAAEAPGEGRRRRPRTVDTVGAMANSGGGLIFIGVSATPADTPHEWGHIPPGTVRPSAIEAHCRNGLEPYVPLAIGIARKPDSTGEVVVVRVDDHPEKPVMVAERGILVRAGQETIHASLAAIRAWTTVGDEARTSLAIDVARMMPGQMSTELPARLAVAIGPSRVWSARQWGDAVDAVADGVVQTTHGPGAPLLVGESVLE